MHLDEAPRVRPSTMPPAANPHLSQEPMRVLVVDCDPTLRDLLARMLTDQGHQVLSLETPAHAPALVREQGVDAVVVGVAPEDGNGADLVRRLRVNSRGADVGIVVLSTSGDEDLQRLVDCGYADAVLPRAELESQLVQQVSRARRHRRLTHRPRRV